MNQEDKKFISDFIKRHKLAVLATIDGQAKPEAAAVEFGETDELEIIFDTSVKYRKYKNMHSNSAVALVIGWDGEMTVQYEGQAIELDEQEKEKYQELYFAKNPDARRWASNPDIKYFKVIPTWIRYSDLNSKPWKIIELNF